MWEIWSRGENRFEHTVRDFWDLGIYFRDFFIFFWILWFFRCFGIFSGILGLIWGFFGGDFSSTWFDLFSFVRISNLENLFLTKKNFIPTLHYHCTNVHPEAYAFVSFWISRTYRCVRIKFLRNVIANISIRIPCYRTTSKW